MRRTILLILLLIVPPAATIAMPHLLELRNVPRRFVEVESGKIFRGGFPDVGDIEYLSRVKGVRTIVSLTGPTDRENEAAMLAEAKRLGLKLYRFPMPGNGRGDYVSMDRAAAAVADEANWPVFFHCAAGKQRSNAVLAAYRLRYCHWPIGKVKVELENRHDLDQSDEKERSLWEHIEGYARRLSREGPSTAPSQK